MSFRVVGLDPGSFSHLFGRSDEELSALGVKRYVVDATPGFPDRVELRDLDVGETALLLNFTHQDAQTPYRASHAIFVREGAHTAYDEVDQIPRALGVRTLSVRAFDSEHMMVDAELVDGCDAETLIRKLLGEPQVAYLHAHYAKRGCYAARIDRV
ncbi:MAG TPA: DUF1203 domain-containing protein [Allosphingosinicella sp.]|jgi:hypothetical protein